MLFNLTIDAMFGVLQWLAGYFPDITLNDSQAIAFLIDTLQSFNAYMIGASWWFPVNFAWQVFIFTLVIESTFTGFFIIVRFVEIIRSLIR